MRAQQRRKVVMPFVWNLHGAHSSRGGESCKELGAFGPIHQVHASPLLKAIPHENLCLQALLLGKRYTNWTMAGCLVTHLMY